MIVNKFIVLLLFLTATSFLIAQKKMMHEIWIGTGTTKEVLALNPTELGSFKNRNRLGASFGLEGRSYLNEYFSINYGLHLKSFRKSFILNFREVFIQDIHICIPVLFHYRLPLKENHFTNLFLGFNGVIYATSNASYSSNDYDILINRQKGIFPNLVFGFGYQFSKRRAFEVNLLYNMGFFQKRSEEVTYKPLETTTAFKNYGSFVEIEFKVRIKKDAHKT